MSDFIAVGNGYRAWRDPAKCDHTNDNICAGCDFDGYYEKAYPLVPWRAESEES